MTYSDPQRDFGEQPIKELMVQHELAPRDIVAASEDQLTFKMITRATKGRRLTSKVQFKILKALNKATQKSYTIKDLFNYV